MDKMNGINTSLCYIEQNGAYLMMHRIKKKNDLNHDKWVGLGGKFENGETPYQCALREVKEEANIEPLNLTYRGVVEFVSNIYGTEYMHLFTANAYLGEINYSSNEGVLEWVKKKDVYNLPIWQGDKIFFELLENEHRFFYLTLTYKGENLVSHTVNIKNAKSTNV